MFIYFPPLHSNLLLLRASVPWHFWRVYSNNCKYVVGGWARWANEFLVSACFLQEDVAVMASTATLLPSCSTDRLLLDTGILENLVVPGYKKLSFQNQPSYLLTSTSQVFLFCMCFEVEMNFDLLKSSTFFKSPLLINEFYCITLVCLYIILAVYRNTNLLAGFIGQDTRDTLATASKKLADSHLDRSSPALSSEEIGALLCRLELAKRLEEDLVKSQEKLDNYRSLARIGDYAGSYVNQLKKFSPDKQIIRRLPARELWKFIDYAGHYVNQLKKSSPDKNMRRPARELWEDIDAERKPGKTRRTYLEDGSSSSKANSSTGPRRCQATKF